MLDKWTTGILYKHPIFTDCRYPLFELDLPESADKSILVKVLRSYRDRRWSLLVHTTGGGGLHFISLNLIHKEDYKIWLSELRQYNKRCPMTTLRINDNKYDNEEWKYLLVDKELYNFGLAIQNGDYEYMAKIFQMVRYKLKGNEIKV